MKINLLTMHYSLSCGAVMQTYATCVILKKLGCDVTIINFKNPIELKRKKSIKFWLVHGVTKIKFDMFRKRYFPERTREIFRINYNDLPIADIYISGSDQIWNPKLLEERIYAYMFDFLPDSVKRISFASSFGVNSWRDYSEYTSKVKNLLSKFDSLSVREDSGVKICNEVFGLNTTQILDPTLVLDDYSNLVGNIKELNQIVCFKLVYDEDFLDTVSLLKKEINLKTTLLYASYPHKNFDRNVMFCSPVKWLKTIASARYVVTDSFHGLAFSLLFKRNFIVLGGLKDRNTRLLSLLRLVGLEDRYVQDFADFIKRKDDLLHKKIDYEKVDRVLSKEREKTYAYLRDALFSK